jgi:NRAMP (natural resistance-associated macrophage protein)-like metal ion transporter
MSPSPRRSKRRGRGLGRDGRRITSETGEVPGETHSHNPLVRYLRVLGPGLVTGASDDDPSGIATYAVAGASVGTSLLWTAAATFPLMAAIQLVCARIGLVSGRGLVAAVRDHYPRWFLHAACLLLLVANMFNIAADLSGMAEALGMLTGIPSRLSIPALGISILLATIWLRYRSFAKYLKWLTLALFAYIFAGFLAKPHWGEIIRATVVPTVKWDRTWLMTFVGILGTTISPYLFFWQASQEVEEEKAQGRRTLKQREGATLHELSDARTDVGIGMLFSNLVMYFIILTTASTLYRSGLHDIETSRQAAEALKPLAGEGAYLLFTIGIVGTGLLAIPVLMGSASYSVSELFRFRAGLDRRFSEAPRFYLIMAIALGGGMALDLLHLSPMRMLFFSAVLNGLLAPPLMVLVMLVGNNRSIMGEHVNGAWLNLFGWTATALMTAAAGAYLVTLLL